MIQTLDTHSRKRDYLDYSMTIFKRTTQRGSRNMIISAANSYDMSYIATNYVFAADTERGQTFINTLYDALPESDETIYIKYSDLFRGERISRMLQEIWTFKTQKEADKYMDEMKDLASEIPFTFLKKLPAKPDFSSQKGINAFLDDHYEASKAKYFHDLIEQHADEIKEHEDHILQVPKLSEEYLDNLAKHISNVQLITRAENYNHQVDMFMAKLANGTYSRSKALELAHRLRRDYNSFYFTYEQGHPMDGVLAKKS